MEKDIVIVSGGLDSAVVLALAANQSDNLMTVHFDYSQPTEQKERECAYKLAEYYDTEHINVNLTPIFKHYKTGIMDDTIDYNGVENGRATTYVAHRNMQLLTIAAAIGEANGYNNLWLGIQASDSDYPDCSNNFRKSIENTLSLSSGILKYNVFAPLINMQKWEIIKLGSELSVPFNLTHSCYINNNKPCNKCASCIERIEGFKKYNKFLLNE